MSSIPPVIGSAIQATVAQRQAAESDEVEAARQQSATRTQAARTDQMEFTVETTDSDTRVNTDGGGLGSQGRPFQREAHAEAEEAEDEADTGITVDA